MAFMVPVAEHFSKAELVEKSPAAFHCAECQRRCYKFNISTSGEGHAACLKCSPPEAGWYARLSAPGYMDATDWHGPYSSEAEALKAVCEFYEVDENGESADETEE